MKCQKTDDEFLSFPMNCQVGMCLNDSGTSIVCRACRRKLIDAEKKKLTTLWHDLVVEKGRRGEVFQCFHCEEVFPRENITGDHWPYTKGSRPDLRYDVQNGQPSCIRCNTSGAKCRKNPKEFFKQVQTPRGSSKIHCSCESVFPR